MSADKKEIAPNLTRISDVAKRPALAMRAPIKLHNLRDHGD